MYTGIPLRPTITASPAIKPKMEQKNKNKRENVEMRLFLMQEEVDDLMGYMEGCSADDAHEQGEISRLDRDALELDRQVKEFMERIKERKHALVS